MSTPTPVYRKLRGGGFSWKGHGRLWRAEDHLLEVTSIYISESYRRFFFQDVRAFVIQRTNLRAIWAAIFGGVGVVCALIASGTWWAGIANSSEDWHIALYIPTALFGLAALVFFVLCVINLSLGQTCRCHVLTSTGWHALSAPTRLGKANRTQTEIVSIVQAAQGPAPTAAPPPL